MIIFAVTICMNLVSAENETSTEYEKNSTEIYEKAENISSAGENGTANENKKNIAKSTESDGKITADNNQKVSKENISKPIILSKYVTGKRTIGIIMLLIVLGIVAIKCIRRE